MTQTQTDDLALARVYALIGRGVAYYDDGWRWGVLEDVKNGWGVIRHPVTGRERARVADIKEYRG
jgi:hypothetical protein